LYFKEVHQISLAAEAMAHPGILTLSAHKQATSHEDTTRIHILMVHEE
jgi:hypothetical protein